MSMRHKRIICTVGVFATVALPLFLALTTRGGEDFARLERVARAEGDEYVQLRDALLETHPEPWDVGVAAGQSWDAGVMAFILNARRGAKDTFRGWDALSPRYTASGRSYSLSGKDWTSVWAFLIEKIWKGETARERDGADYDLQQYCRESTIELGHLALWHAIWDGCDDERLQSVAVFQLCSNPDPSTQPIIVELLKGGNGSLDARRLRGQCMSGLWYRDTEQTVDAVLGVWDALSKTGHWEYSGAGVLARTSSERARRFVYDLVLDSSEDERLRAETLMHFCHRPQPGDIQVFRKFFAGPGSDKMKWDALGGLYRYPLNDIRPLLRELLMDSTDPKMIASAAFALSKADLSTKDVPDATKAEDIALFEEVLRTREDLHETARVHIDLYIRRLRAKPGDPRPTLPDPPQDR